MELLLEGSKVPISVNYAWPEYLIFMDSVPARRPNLQVQVKSLGNSQTRALVTVKNVADDDKSFPSIFTSFTLDNDTELKPEIKIRKDHMSQDLNSLFL
jgi:hypothetical protein